MRRVLRERFVKTAELSLFALTTGMPRRDAARIFYQVCGAFLALAYPGIPCHETAYSLLRTTPVHAVGASFHSMFCVALCPTPYPSSALFVSLTKPCQAACACLLSRVKSLLCPSQRTDLFWAWPLWAQPVSQQPIRNISIVPYYIT